MSNNTPNWLHHSKKERKGKKKPRLIQQAKASLKAFKAKHNITSTN